MKNYPPNHQQNSTWKCGSYTTIFSDSHNENLCSVWDNLKHDMIWYMAVQDRFIKNFVSISSFLNLSHLSKLFISQEHISWFLAATKQLYKWYFPSVCPSVRLSVCLSVRLSVCPSVRPSVTPFWLCSPHRIIMKFSGVITNDKSKVHAKGKGQRSKVKVTEVTTQLNRFRTVTPVWILIWWWNDAYSLMLLRRGALLFFKVIRQISRSHGSKNRQIWPRLGVSGL